MFIFRTTKIAATTISTRAAAKIPTSITHHPETGIAAAMSVSYFAEWGAHTEYSALIMSVAYIGEAWFTSRKESKEKAQAHEVPRT